MNNYNYDEKWIQTKHQLFVNYISSGGVHLHRSMKLIQRCILYIFFWSTVLDRWSYLMCSNLIIKWNSIVRVKQLKFVIWNNRRPVLFKMKYENSTELIANLRPLNTKENIPHWKCKKSDVAEIRSCEDHETLVLVPRFIENATKYK